MNFITFLDEKSFKNTPNIKFNININNKRKNMKNIAKLFLVILTTVSFTVSALVSSAFAGDLAVTGGATATYSIGGAHQSNSKGLGVSNEVDFTATGELDNGYAWKWQAQMDNATRVNDDTRMELTTPYGLVGMYISEGGLSSEAAYGAGAMGPGSDYQNPMTIVFNYDVDSYNSVQYHLADGILPYGITAKVAYVPNLSGAAGDSAKTAGAVETNAVGSEAWMYRVDIKPVDGLSIGADYFNASPTTGARYDQESGNAYAKYVMGPVTVGFAKSAAVPIVAKGSETSFYETDAYGIQFAVNEALSVSWGTEKSEKSTRTAVAAGATVGTKATVESVVDHIQAAYVIGGATLGVAVADASDSDYTAGREEKMTKFSIAMAF